MACAPAANYSTTLNLQTFRWPDINYTDTTRSDWQLSHHLLRTVALYRSFLCTQCDLSAPVAHRRLAEAHGALGAYVRLSPTAPQWWWDDIGIPGYLGACLTLADAAGGLPPATRAGGIKLMAHDHGDTGGGGQNLVWEQQAIVFRGSLTKDAALVAAAFATVWEAIHVTDGDGIQADASFYQHGPLLQSGAYGSDYALDLITLRALSSGTAFAATTAAATAIDNYVLDGEALFMRWNGQSGAASQIWWDVACKGREISRGPLGELHANTAPLAPALRAATDSQRHAELLVLADRMQGNGSHLVASRHFWRVDTAVHHRTLFAASVHMCSNRTYPTEFVNGENSRAWLAGGGTQYFYSDGSEYSGIFPVWDWRHLPGVTARNTTDFKPGQVCWRLARQMANRNRVGNGRNGEKSRRAESPRMREKGGIKAEQRLR